MICFLELFLCVSGSIETNMIQTGCSNMRINLIRITEYMFIIMYKKFACRFPHLLMFLYFLA